MFKVLIVDDEFKIREVLKTKINKLFPTVEIVGEAASADEAYTKINTLDPDVVFLDISMPIESGFDLLNRFDQVNFEIIFATGYDEYALEALKVSAIDYILKPFRNEDLEKAIMKAKTRIDSKQKANQYELLKHNLNHPGDQDSKIAIPNQNSYDFVPIKDIIRCEGDQKYTRIYKSDKSNILSSYHIGHYVKLLESFGFYLIHKSHLINKKHIDSYLREGTVIMNDDSQVPVSRRKKDEFVRDVIKIIG